MTFDGVDYSSCGLIAPVAYHPKAPLSGTPLQEAMRGAYYFSRHSGRMLACQPYAWNARNAAMSNERNVQAYNDNYWSILECYIDVPPYATHLVAMVSFGFLSQDEHTVFHRIEATDGSTTDTGTATEIVMTGNDLPYQAQDGSDDTKALRRGLSNADPASLFSSVRTAYCELELSDMYTTSSKNGVLVSVKTRFSKSESSSDLSGYRPGFVWLGYECRG